MSEDETDTGRRRMLQLTGTTIMGLVGTAGLTTAQPDHAGERGPPDHANVPGWLVKEGNEIELGVTEREYQSVSAREVDGIPNDAHRVPFEVLQLQIQALNEEIEANNMMFERNSSGFSLTRTGETDLSEYGIDQ